MTHIKNIITDLTRNKKNSINYWKECYVCEHMVRPDRINIYPNLGDDWKETEIFICDECN